MHSLHCHTVSAPGLDVENSVYAQYGVGLYVSQSRTRWPQGKVTITPYDMFFESCDTHKEEVLQFSLEDVLISGQNIRCKTESESTHAEVLVPLRGDDAYLIYFFQSGGMKEFYAALYLAVKKTEWRVLSSSLSFSSSAQVEVVQSEAAACDHQKNDISSPHEPLRTSVTNVNMTTDLKDFEDILARFKLDKSENHNLNGFRHLVHTDSVRHSVSSGNAKDSFVKNFVVSGENVECSSSTSCNNISAQKNKDDLSNVHLDRSDFSSTSDAPNDAVVDDKAVQSEFASSFWHPYPGIEENYLKSLSITDQVNVTPCNITTPSGKLPNIYCSTTKHQCRDGSDSFSRVECVPDIVEGHAVRSTDFSIVREITETFDIASANSEAFAEPALPSEIIYHVQPCEAPRSMPRLEYEMAVGSSSGINRPRVVSSSGPSANSITESNSLFSVTDRAGIAGVMRASAESTPLDQTLRDIDDVMKDASSIVANIRHLKQKQSGPVSAEDDTAIESIEATLGIGAMVKNAHGTLYNNRFYNDLAQELHAWITHEKNFSVFGSRPLIPLIELFALYNKARGGRDLVSPGDVLNACRVIDKRPDSVYRLKDLSSGRFALQHKDPFLVLENLSQLLGPRLCTPKQKAELKVSERRQQETTRTASSRGNIETITNFPQSSTELKSINEVQFAARIQVARSVALDLLEDFEQQGYLCRSGGGFGCVSFHWNVFVF